MNKITATTTLKTALDSAVFLKRDLLRRLKGTVVYASPHGCGGPGEGKAYDICYPTDSLRPFEIGSFENWKVLFSKKEERRVYSFDLPLTAIISREELYPIFRDAFESFGVPVSHPESLGLLRPACENWYGEGLGRNFIGSRRTVVVTEDKHVLLAPLADWCHMPWVDANLRVLRRPHNLNVFLTGCDIDAAGVSENPGEGRIGLGRECYGGEHAAANSLTFCVAIPEHNQIITRIPIARLVAFDPITGAHTFELDRDVEEVAWDEEDEY